MNDIATSPKVLGHILKRYRKCQHLSQQNIVNRSAIGQKSISFAEQGRAGVQIETLFRLLSALELEMEIRPRQKMHQIGSESENSNTFTETDEKEQW